MTEREQQISDEMEQEDWELAIDDRRAEETKRDNQLWDAGAEARFYEEVAR